ncbi:MAG: protein kinase [Gammaproteobacteria bacterium]
MALLHTAWLQKVWFPGLARFATHSAPQSVLDQSALGQSVLGQSALNKRTEAYRALCKQYDPPRTAHNMLENMYLPIRGVLYQLTPFAHGGVCDVFQAHNSSEIAPTLIIKMIRPDWLSHQALAQQFKLEIDVLRGLRHPMLPQLFADGMYDDRAFLAYVQLPGEPLMAFAQRGELYGDACAHTTVLGIVRALLHQLEYLHSKNDAVVHGDISAENIIYTPQLGPQLVDFGCAHYRKSPTPNSKRWIAKPSYLSPEQARGEAWTWTSDVYQMGILCYELLTAERWITGATPHEKMLNAAHQKRPSPSFLGHLTSRRVAMCVRDMLHPDPHARAAYSAGELAHRLES